LFYSVSRPGLSSPAQHDRWSLVITGLVCTALLPVPPIKYSSPTSAGNLSKACGSVLVCQDRLTLATLMRKAYHTQLGVTSWLRGAAATRKSTAQ